MPSPLLIDSAGFRKKLITRNLVPYAKSPNKADPPIDYEVIQSDLSVIDSPDQLIDEPSFANKLFPLNQYGNDGGYKQVPDPGSLLNNKSNEGEYGFQDANIIDEGYDAPRNWRPLNAYADTTQIFDAANAIASFETVRPDQDRTPNSQPYPASIVNSSYSPVSILLTKDPLGSNGLLSQDSFLARLGAVKLKEAFENNINREVAKNTIGRANIFNVRSGTDVLNLVTGRVPLIEPDYTITMPANPVLAATSYALRLAGSILPVSTIPGSYFDTSINPGQPTTIQQLQNAFRQSNNGVGKFFNRLLGGDKTGSQLFLNNTGGGQKSRLFGNLDYNKFKPDYDRTLFDRVAGVLVGSTTNNSDFYVGSKTSDPSRIFSPGGDLPVNEFGQEVQSPVYGPQEMAQLYEGPSQDVRLGANGPTYSDGGGVEGGFTWVSPKYKGNAGKKVGIGGEVTNQSEDFKQTSYDSTESTNRTFREGSILDDTQRIIDSQPSGGRRLQHVGNAIDQVSKVFNDGYKELTKGSRVLSYVGSIGNEVGTEYCRVFAKDIPYLQYNNLQKTDGMTTEGRKFSYSVFDKTYNLNIVPNKREGGQDSSNLIGDTTQIYAKKYMFSLENLAWRTGGSPGYTVSDLAICERGPNGGRVMWFPPYGLVFTEAVSANWNTTDFIGRPEPIYTYKNTSRGGTLQWKVVVDHPSVLNVIVNKILTNETNKARIDQMLESFFAGCLKYDLYELAKKYYTIPPNDLQNLQDAISSKNLTKEQLQYSLQTVQSGNNSPGNSASQPITSSNGANSAPEVTFKTFENLGFYFGNDYPKTFGVNYDTEYSRYTSSSNKTYYQQQSPSTSEQTSSFFNSVVTSNYDKLYDFINELDKQLTNNTEGTVTITIDGTTSPPASKTYNQTLSEKRIDSAFIFFSSNTTIQKWIKTTRLIINKGKALGENAEVLKYDAKSAKFMPAEKVSCSDNDGDNQKISKEIYTTNAMACRRAYISSIISTLKQPPPQEPVNVTQQNPPDVLVGTRVPATTKPQNLEQNPKPNDNITKKVLRALLSECDYFETIKQDTPMVYDNLKEKLKFFQPAFHSTTPEGLNSRLTFLQQCMRPGDTIPTIKQNSPDGKPELQYNNATNTAFGTPPVLVLRVGDFYNTKIIPTSLNISYENLDLNPEGIGIQPMIANITLGFNFVGGSGLKTAVDKLQNALSFNYYANTEMYDDRADVTDDSLKIIDKNFSDYLKTVPPTTNQVQNNNGQSNGDTIGSIISTVKNVSGDTSGTISYATFMDNFSEASQNYFTNFINKSKESLKQYNNALLQNWTAERLYVDGNLLSNTIFNVQLIGKPNLDSKKNGLAYRIDKVFDDLISNIKTDNEEEQDRFIKYMSQKKLGFSEKVIRQLKHNYGNFIKNKKSRYQNDITQITQSITIAQQNYIQYLSKANVLLYPPTPTEGTDGYQQKNGNTVIYNISGTTDVYQGSSGTTLDELNQDIKKIGDGLIGYYQLAQNPVLFRYESTDYNGYLLYGGNSENDNTSAKTLLNEVFNPFSKLKEFTNKTFRRMYMILSNDIIDDKNFQTFKKAIIGDIMNNSTILGNGNTDIDKEFSFYWLSIAKPKFENENNITTEFLNSIEKVAFKDFVVYTPFPKNKKRVFTYNISISPQNEQKKLITGLNNATQAGNQNTNTKTWNTSVGTNVYISKIKLN